MSRLIPTQDKILVRKDVEKERVVGGIVLPQVAFGNERFAVGEILAVGPGWWDERSGEFRAVALRVGDRVVFSKHAGREIEVDGESYVVLREEDAVARVVQEEE